MYFGRYIFLQEQTQKKWIEPTTESNEICFHLFDDKIQFRNKIMKGDNKLLLGEVFIVHSEGLRIKGI